MTIIEKLAETNPEIESVTVTVHEFCSTDHPPASEQWKYNESWEVDSEVLGALYHDKTTLKTAKFDLLSPIRSTLARKVDEYTGRLPAYHTEDGRTVSRRYECKIVRKSGAPWVGTSSQAT